MVILFRWHLPHFSTQISPALTRARSPFTVYLGPSTESLMAAVTSVTRVTRVTLGAGGRGRRVALVTHHTGLLDTGSVVSQLQEENIAVQVRIYQYQTTRPSILGSVCLTK